MAWYNRFFNLFRSERVSREIDREFAFHLAERVDELVASGMTPEEARRAAYCHFGSTGLAKERTRDVDLPEWADRVAQDLRYAARTLRKSPGFTLAAVLTLALGIGANVAIFSAVDRILVRPLPYPEASRLAVLWEDARWIGFPHNNLSPADWVDWNRQNHVFEEIAAIRYRAGNLSGGNQPEMVIGNGVTASFFRIMRVPPLLGRTFSDDEDGRDAPVVVLSYPLWQGRYRGDSGIVGQEIVMNGAKRTVIGIMPKEFRYREKSAFWIPTQFTSSDLANRHSHFLNTIARLKSGASFVQAQQEMSAIAGRLEREYPGTNLHVGAVVVPFKEELTGSIRLALTVLLGASICVLLIACSNIANLLLARATGRQREMAIRIALGAGRRRLVVQMITESLMLATLGGAMGLMVALWCMKALKAFTPAAFEGSGGLGIDGRLLLFTFAVSMLTGLLFGIAPALRSATVPVNETLKDGGRSRTSSRGNVLRYVLVGSEVALAVVLLVAASLMLETLAKLRGIDAGFRPSNVLTMQVILPRSTEDGERRAFFHSTLERINALPGVKIAGYASDLPFTSRGDTTGFWVEGRPTPERTDTLYREVTTNYLQTIGAELKEGRFFGPQDLTDAPRVAIINDTFARIYWSGVSAVGKRVKVNDTDPNDPWATIVGVVKDIRERGLDWEMKPASYLPAEQVTHPAPGYLAVRTAGDPLSLVSAVRRAIWAVNGEQPIFDVGTMEQIQDAELANRHEAMILLSSFAALALLLSSLGIYGVLSYAVNQRRGEIGIRMALGAGRGNVLAMMIGQGLGAVMGGVVAGLLLAIALTRVLGELLYGISATDPLTLVGASTFLVLVGLLACFIPSRRATRVDPVVALRYE
jgi:predicted permease